MQNTLSETVQQAIMTIVGKNPSKTQEGEIQKEIIVLFFQVTQGFAKKADYEIKNVMQHFICFFMAHFSAAKNTGALKADFLFQTFLERTDRTISLFMSNICLPQCENGNADAAEAILKTGMIIDDYKVNKEIDELLIKAAKNESCTELILSAISKHISDRHSLLETCSHINQNRTYELCVQSITEKSSTDHKKTALRTLSSMSLGHGQLRHVAVTAGELLNNADFTEDCEARKLTYTLIAKAIKVKALEESEAAAILQKAFNHESTGHGLEDILKLLYQLNKRTAEENFLQGLLKIETRKCDNRFIFRDKVVKNFLQKISPEGRSLFLQKAITKSQDADFLWYACEELLVCDTLATASKTLERALKNGSQEKVGIITRFALEIREKPRGWGEGLENISKAELEKMVDVLLACTQSKKAGQGFEIAKNTIMSGGKPADIKNVLPILHSIALDCDKNFSEAVHLLLVCSSDKEKGVTKEAQDILNDLLGRKRTELLKILTDLLKSQWNWDCTCLTTSSIDFLAQHKITEVMPEMTANLKTSWRNNGINYAGVRYFSELSLAGSTEAIKILAKYDSSNILSDTIPKTLVAIYHNKASNDQIKQLILEGICQRFIASIHKNSINGICYLSELAAMEKLHKEDGIFDTYLAGITAIGEAKYHSPGMDKIIQKAEQFAGKKRLPQVLELIGPMITSLQNKQQTLSDHINHEREHKRGITYIVHAATELMLM